MQAWGPYLCLDPKYPLLKKKQDVAHTFVFPAQKCKRQNYPSGLGHNQGTTDEEATLWHHILASVCGSQKYLYSCTCKNTHDHVYTHVYHTYMKKLLLKLFRMLWVPSEFES